MSNLPLEYPASSENNREYPVYSDSRASRTRFPELEEVQDRSIDPSFAPFRKVIFVVNRFLTATRFGVSTVKLTLPFLGYVNRWASRRKKVKKKEKKG